MILLRLRFGDEHEFPVVVPARRAFDCLKCRCANFRRLALEMIFEIFDRIPCAVRQSRDGNIILSWPSISLKQTTGSSDLIGIVLNPGDTGVHEYGNDSRSVF